MLDISSGKFRVKSLANHVTTLQCLLVIFAGAAQPAANQIQPRRGRLDSYILNRMRFVNNAGNARKDRVAEFVFFEECVKLTMPTRFSIKAFADCQEAFQGCTSGRASHVRRYTFRMADVNTQSAPPTPRLKPLFRA